MCKLSYTAKLRLSITIKEVLQYTETINCTKSELKYHIKNELMQCAEGIINGESGGSYNEDWRIIFFKNLEKDGIIKLNSKFNKDF